MAQSCSLRFASPSLMFGCECALCCFPLGGGTDSRDEDDDGASRGGDGVGRLRFEPAAAEGIFPPADEQIDFDLRSIFALLIGSRSRPFLDLFHAAHCCFMVLPSVFLIRLPFGPPYASSLALELRGEGGGRGTCRTKKGGHKKRKERAAATEAGKEGRESGVGESRLLHFLLPLNGVGLTP